MKNLNYFFISGSLIAFLLTASCSNSCHDKTIQISAQNVKQNESQTIYSKDVVIVDKAITIKAAKAFMENADSQKAKVIANGDPATFEQNPASNQIVTGSAKILEYSPKLDKILLKGDAIFIKNGKTIKGDKIKYNLKTGRYVSE